MNLQRKIDCVHLGMVKTGSTFLQKNIFDKIDLEVLSDEKFSGDACSGRKNEIIKRELILYGIRLKYGQDIKIILCVRNKEKWVQSCYNQYIKGDANGVHSYDYWLDNIFDKDFIYEHDRYINIVKFLFKDVYIYRFEDFLENKPKILNEILDFLGVELHGGIPIDEIYNRRLSSVELYLMRVLNMMKEFYMKYFVNRYRVKK